MSGNLKSKFGAVQLLTFLSFLDPNLDCHCYKNLDDELNSGDLIIYYSCNVIVDRLPNGKALSLDTRYSTLILRIVMYIQHLT